MDMAWQYILVAIGGGLGAAFRWMAVEVATRWRIPAWLSIIGVNVLGCLVMGMVVAATVGPQVEAVVVVGALGGFTTFSTAMLDAWILWRTRRRFAAGTCLLLTPLIGVVAVWAGWKGVLVVVGPTGLPA